MAITSNRTATRCASTTAKTGTTLCPTCGGLECLCRPRFFADNGVPRYLLEKPRGEARRLPGPAGPLAGIGDGQFPHCPRHPHVGKASLLFKTPG